MNMDNFDDKILTALREVLATLASTTPTSMLRFGAQRPHAASFDGRRPGSRSQSFSRRFMQDLASKFKIALSRIVVWSLRPGRSAYSLPNLHPVCDLNLRWAPRFDSLPALVTHIGCFIRCKHEGCLWSAA
jgi:hypothetical protein